MAVSVKRTIATATATGVSPDVDVIQVPSGEKWTILRATYTVTAIGGTPVLELKRTTSADALQEFLVDETSPSVTVKSRVLNREETTDPVRNLVGMVMTDQDKIRLGAPGTGDSITVRLTISAVVET